MQQECEQKSRQLSTATKRMAVLNNKFKQVEGQLEEEKAQTTLLHQQARQAFAVKYMHSEAFCHPQKDHELFDHDLFSCMRPTHQAKLLATECCEPAYSCLSTSVLQQLTAMQEDVSQPSHSIYVHRKENHVA